mgnify:CR=1 FL=1
MITTELESSVTLSTETWNMARMITESQHEAEDLVQNICHGVTHLPDNQQSMAVMMHINLLASKVMTRH